MPQPAPDRSLDASWSSVLRLLGAVGLAIALVVAGLQLAGDDEEVPVAAEVEDDRTVEADDFARSAADLAERATRRARGVTGGKVSADGHVHAGVDPLVDGDDGHGHDHSDPTTKNALSRSAPEETAETRDPTTPMQAAAARDVVEAQRAEAMPYLTTAQFERTRTAVPADRYAMANGCYALQAPSGRWVTRSGSGLRASAPRIRGAAPFHFRATDLGKYLVYGTKRDFVTRAGGPLLGLGTSNRIVMAAKPSKRGDYTVTKKGPGFRFALGNGGLAVAGDGALVFGKQPTAFRLRATTGCAKYPEVQVNIKGAPHAGQTAHQQVVGYVDAHTHGMAYEFLGGRAHCGKPWHPYGAAYALVDCLDHTITGGYGALLEAVLSGKPTHDPVGWPTFKDWPAPDSLTHEGTYYKWIERSWRGGLRLFVNLLVENNQLCLLYPLKKNSCDDMDSIRLQAKRMKQFQRYIDAQSGGPGRGWYRIVKNPVQARKVINAGKLAVVMGIETSIPFGCTMKLDIPQCNRAEIDRQLDAMHKMGVRQMELVNKFDNALSGVAGDEGATGLLVGTANFLETGTFWQMEKCTYKNPEVADKTQGLAPPRAGQQDALFGAIAKLHLPTQPLPIYPSAPHCNKRGLTALGEHTIRGLVKRKMLFDPDHMSVVARKASMDLIEKLGYSGVLSSHSWSTPDAYPRIAKAGGFIAPYAGDSTGFVKKWKRHVTWADKRYLFGIGYGADINGLGAQGNPRGAKAKNKVTYPFKGLGGITVRKQRSGKRVYDINVDGVAHYGLYPDWIEDLRKLAGPRIVRDMERGAEAYLQMWERAVGIRNNGCRDTANRTPLRKFRTLKRGMSASTVLRRVGMPGKRAAGGFAYCAKRPNGKTVRVRVDLTGKGKVTRVRL